MNEAARHRLDQRLWSTSWILFVLGLLLLGFFLAMFAAENVHAQGAVDERWYASCKADPDAFVTAVAETVQEVVPSDLWALFKTTLAGKLQVGALAVDALPSDWTRGQVKSLRAINQHLERMGAVNAEALIQSLATNLEFGEGEGEGGP